MPRCSGKRNCPSPATSVRVLRRGAHRTVVQPHPAATPSALVRSGFPGSSTIRGFRLPVSASLIAAFPLPTLRYARSPPVSDQASKSGLWSSLKSARDTARRSAIASTLGRKGSFRLANLPDPSPWRTIGLCRSERPKMSVWPSRSISHHIAKRSGGESVAPGPNRLAKSAPGSC